MTTIAERAAAFFRRRIFKDLNVLTEHTPTEAEEAAAMDAYLRHVAEHPFVTPDAASCTCSYDRKRGEVHFADRHGLLAVLSRNGLETAAEWNARLGAEKADYGRACDYLAETVGSMPPAPPAPRSDSA